MKSSSSLRHWINKFRNAMRGLRVGVRGQTSFYVHFVMTALVLAAAVFLRVNLLEWCVLLLCIGIVMSAELFNSALESAASAITNDFDDDIRDALDIASAAVLMAAITASIVGTTVFVFRLGMYMGWWAGYLLY